jgi:hypothetical protein
MTTSVMTASRLHDGIVVFLGAQGWVEEFEGATLATTAEAAKALEALGQQSVAVNEVVDAYLIEVTAEAGAIRPVKLREHLRALGPSVRTDLGKQARRAGGVHVSL